MAREKIVKIFLIRIKGKRNEIGRRESYREKKREKEVERRGNRERNE